MSTLSSLPASIYVGVGGGIGAIMRYQTGRVMTAWMGNNVMAAFPWATLTVNALGSLLMGLLMAWLARDGDGGADHLRLLLGVGMLGGFTTFSSFSLELVMLLERGSYAYAANYAFLSFALGVCGLMLGFTLIRNLA